MSDILNQIKSARVAYEMKVEQAALETIEVAKQVSQTLGDVSLEELNAFIVRYFAERLDAPSFYAEFQGKKEP